MTSLKYVFGALALLLLMATAYAAEPLETQVSLQPVNDEGTIVDVSVLVFTPPPGASGTERRAAMEEIVSQCRLDEPTNWQACVLRESAAYDAAHPAAKMNVSSLNDAHLEFYYSTAYGTEALIDACADVVASTPSTMYRTNPDTGAAEEVTVYSGRCTIPSSVYEGQVSTTVVVRFPDVVIGDQEYLPSEYRYEIRVADIGPGTTLTKQLNDAIEALQRGGGGSTLPCLGAFLILGMLFASMYFSGKSPVSLLDITTPRLPAPKGVAAGGQILGPFGYTEMKMTAKGKMGAAITALNVAGKNLPGGSGASDPATQRLLSQIDRQAISRADQAAGDADQNKAFQRALVLGGRSAGMSARDLEPLVGRLPYHYGEAEQRVVAQIIQALRAQGGKSALYAETLQQFTFSQRTFQSLEALTAHPDIGKRSAAHYMLTNTVGKAFGANRYTQLGGFVMPAIDSTVRSGRIVGRMGKAIVTEAAPLTRNIAKTTMEMVGGKRAMEDLAASAKRGGAAEWVHAQLTKHPSKVMIGQMFPVQDKMGALYSTLKNETQRDQMRYLVGQIYKKMGLRFDVGEKELVAMGHTDMDILKRSGYKASPELAKAEAEIRKIVGDTAKSAQQKVAELSELAKRVGAHVDPHLVQVTERMGAIEHAAEPEYVKMLRLQQLLAEENTLRSAAVAAGRGADEAYLCRVGGDSLRGEQIWSQLVLRTHIYDLEHGFQGGAKEAVLSAYLNTVNREVTLRPTQGMENLPEYMRNASQLKGVEERSRNALMELFTADGKKLFEQTNRKTMAQATTEELVKFMYGGGTAGTGHIDKATGKMVWWGNDQELSLPSGTTKVDLKRHWVVGLDPRENFAIGQWVESRFTKSYVPPQKASVEAELDRMAGSASWTVEQRAREAKKLWVLDHVRSDMESRFNSHFGMNTYGTTHETTRFYAGVLSGFMDKTLRDRGMESNHHDLRFLEQLDVNNPKHLAKLSGMLNANRAAFEETIRKPVSYDDIARSNKAMVMLYEGGFAYYQKGMMLSDKDRVLGGEVSLRDSKGQLRAFVPDDVPIKFAGRDDLAREFERVRSSKDPKEWEQFLHATTKWTKSGGYDYEKEKVLAGVLWQYSNTTYDYSRFWNESAVTVGAKREVTPLAPSPLRFFGVESPGFTTTMKPVRDIGLHFGDYVSKIALVSGGPVHKASYDITPVSEFDRQHSWRLASKIMSGDINKMGLTKDEQVAYRAVAISHFGAHQVWDYAIDRNPWAYSTSYGAHQAWNSFFQFGPSQTYSVRDNLRAYLDKGQYANFMATYGFPMNAAGKMLRPYTNMVRGLQMSMQGYTSRWDLREDPLRAYDYTQPRIREAMQSMNPFSFKWFPGKSSETISNLNKYGGSLEHHQLQGRDFSKGLMVAPSDIFGSLKGVYSPARYGEANPGASYYDYRNELKFDPRMAEYLYRTKEAAYLYDDKVREAAMTTTVRRTVSAEALAIRREQELRGFGIMQNPMFGWASPVSFIWHMPVPGFPQSASPKDVVSNYVRRSKHGGGGSFSESLKAMMERTSQGTSRLMQPSKLSMVVYCPTCGMSGMRGSRCKNISCKATLY